MGTRSTIKFYQGEEFLCAVYKQYDGYLEGVGEDIKTFIKSKPFVNGIGNDRNVFNGAGCFVAQFIKYFKKGAGGLYITFENDDQEYNYLVIIEDSLCPSTIEIKCINEPYDDEEKELIEKFNERIELTMKY
jgi:hypothetical protein